MILVSVQDGTGAGVKRIRRLERWTCRCPGRDHPGNRYSCPDCGMRRPT